MKKKNIKLILLKILIIKYIIILLLQTKDIEKFSDTNITIVSSYYPMKSKHSIEEYKEWIKNLFGNISFNLVFFTNKEYTPFIKDIRKNYSNTKIITLEFEELEVFKKYPLSFWKEQKRMDHEEYHTPELYAIWYEKKEFIKKAIKMNPFNSEYFIWTDAGICRDSKWIPYLKNYPSLNKIPDDKILISRITSDFEMYADLQHRDCVAGNLIAGHKNIWPIYYKYYDETMNNYIDSNKFTGKDQSIIGTTVINHKELFKLYDAKDGKINNIEYNLWFSLLFYLA